jgi:hypothetical protein
VNRPSVEALRPDHGWGNSRHTQSCRTRQERKCGDKGERMHATGIVEEKTEGTLEIQRVLNSGEGEKTFVLDFR